MASKALLLMIIVAASAAPGFAIDHIVGDDSGWKLGVNYTAWAEGKQFYLGDKLVFKYGQGAHNVHKVNGTAFQQCMVPSAPGPLTSGNDVIPLTTPGRKWYICGVGNHCASGMKLVITVASTEAPTEAPAPTPGTSAGNHLSPLKSSVWMLTALVVLKMIPA